LILKTEDGGSTWKETFGKNDIVLKDVLFFDNNNGIVVGEWGTIFTTIDGGNTWNSCDSIYAPGLNSCFKLTDNSLIVVGEAGVILRFNLNPVQGQTTTSVQNTSISPTNFKIYPNPSKGSLNLVLNQDNQYTLKIFSCLDQEVSVLDIKEKETNIDLINIPSGIYFVNLSNEKEAYSQKIIIE
jgi:hypothetical protein